MTADQPVYADVGPPPDAEAVPAAAVVPVVVREAVAAPGASGGHSVGRVPLSRPARRGRVPVPVPASVQRPAFGVGPQPAQDAEPDIPFDPLPPGALAALVEQTDPEAAERMRAADRAARGEAEPVADAGTVREQAADALAEALPALRRVLRDADASAPDVAAAVRALAQLAERAEAADDGEQMDEADIVARLLELEVQRVALVQARTPGGDERQAGV